ncbi:MAG: hypothetical protein DHS20C05_21630 [Hyphococcus sp.]|nr:MAG: hypothetical protein DHS20C05_21630 [Marinicaulis sp.]
MNEHLSLPDAVEKYLDTLNTALRALPADRRHEIVSEIREHMTERIASGADVNECLASFGDPDLYAAQFITEHKLVDALSSDRSSTMIRVLLNAATKSTQAASVAFCILLVWVLTLPFVFFGIAKLFYPSAVGLWKVGDGFVMGFNRDGATQEVLGWGLPLIGCVALIAAIHASRRLARYGVGKLLANRQNASTL